MNEESSIPPSAIPDESDTDVVSLLKKMQQQMLFLERKIDLLIRQSQERQPVEKTFPNRPSQKRPFTKQYRSFDHPRRRSGGEQGHSPRESGSAPGHFYENRPRGKSRSINPKKKSFSFKRKDQE
jgi:hypothetical protein